MKKIILLSFLALSFQAKNVMAQSTSDNIFQKYRFGIFLGPTFNSYKPTASTAKDNDGGTYTVSKNGGNTGFSFGLTGELNLNERYTVFSGLGLDWRGGSILAVHDTNSFSTNYAKSADISYKHQFLTIPIGLKMKATEFDKFKIYAVTGFDLGILLSQKGSYKTVLNDSALTVSQNEKVKLNDYARAVPIALGWSIGVGSEYALTEKNSVYASLTYRNGFTDATLPKSNKAQFRFADGNVRSNTIALRIGYYF